MLRAFKPWDSSANSDPVLDAGPVFDANAVPDPTLANATVLPSHGMIDGETLSQWTQDWWTWAVQTPVATSPMLDTTGAYAGVDNTAAMFFLAGTFSGNVERTFDVPGNKPLLVPILNDLVLQYTGKGPDPLTGGKGAADQLLADWQKSVTSLVLDIDNHPVGNLQSDLVRTDFFSLGTVQPGSVAQAFGLSGELAPSKSDGYWAVIQGLAPGSHTIDFGGSSNAGSFHITDHIKVV